jgi:acid phosphatase (class A)
MGGGWFDGQGSGWQDAVGPATGSGGGQTFAMRADKPMAADDIDLTPNDNPHFLMHGWDADIYALSFMPDFISAIYEGKSWEQYLIEKIGPPPAVMGPGQTGNPDDDRIDDLRRFAVTDRPEAMGEILNQNKNQQLCFLQLMLMNHASHPKTYFVMKLAARVGELVMIRLKRHFNRARPTQYCPILYPPVTIPGHASYPAGHAVIADLTAAVLTEVTTNPKTGISPYKASLNRLAHDIGMNRVYAGLHFMSDIKAGAQAGRLTHDILRSLPAAPVNAADPTKSPSAADFTYASAVNAAKAEWP